MKFIYNVRSHEKYVYHYTSAETARDYVLKSHTLLLNTLAATNDPRESKDWTFNLWTSGKHDLGQYDTTELSAWLSTALKSTARLACFSRDQSPLSGDHTQDLFKRGLSRSRMWAQYGDRHKGVCLVFDRELLIRSAKTHLVPRMLAEGDVLYKDHHIVRGLGLNEFVINVDELEFLGRQRYCLYHAQRYHRELFFEKLTDWRDEVEWRILAWGTDERPLYLPLGNSLIGIIHGASISPVISDELIAMAEGTTVEHMGLKWINSVPWYDFGEPHWSASNRALFKWKPRVR